MDSDATGSGARGYGTIKTVDIISNFDKNLINGTRESRASYYCTRILLTNFGGDVGYQKGWFRKCRQKWCVWEASTVYAASTIIAESLPEI